MFRFSHARACFIACASLAYVDLWAQEALTLREAVNRSVQRHPDLAVFDLDLQAQDGRILQAGAAPSLEVGVLVENALGTGSRSSFKSAETTLSLGFLLEHGALEKRRLAASVGREVIATELTIRRLDIAAETTRRYITVLEAQRRIDEVQRGRELIEQMLTAVESRVKAAKVPRAEADRAQVQLAKSQLDQEHAEHELLTARRRLAATWGDTDAKFASAAGDLSQLPDLPVYATLHARLQKNLDFDRFASEDRLRQAELQVAEARRRPPWQLTAGVRRFEDADDHALIVGLAIPLPSRDYGRGGVATARAQVDAVAVRREAMRVQLDGDLFAFYQELIHAYKEVAVMRDDVLPKMQQAMEASRYAYERGRYSYLEWVAAQRDLLDTRRALLEACADAHRYRIEVERLTGASLEQPLP